MQEESRVINTNRHFQAGGPTHLSGRKYVCEPCAVELGEAVGLVDGALIEDADKYIDKLRNRNEYLEEQVCDLANFQELADRLVPKPAPKPKPKPATKES